MKICRLILSILLCVSFLLACTQPTDEEVYYKVQKKLGKLTSYECIMTVNMSQGDNQTEYIYKQYFKKPNSYRLELLSPEPLKGNLMVSNGKMAWVYSPSINQTYRIDSIQKFNKELLFIGYFMQNYMTSKEVDIVSATNDNQSFILITADIPGGNYHFAKQKLWIDKKEIAPTKLQILDQQNKLVLEVIYEDFKYNPKLDEDMFHLNLQP